MILTVSASQGQGKTTFLNDVLKHSRHRNDLSLYPTKSARTVISEFGGNLQHIYEDKDVLCEFQLSILQLHSEILQYKYYTKYLLVERSFMDILAFSVINLGRFNDLRDWLNAFASACQAKQNLVHSIFYIEKNLVPSYDGIRPNNEMYNTAYALYLKSLVSTFPYKSITCSERMHRVEEFDIHLDKEFVV